MTSTAPNPGQMRVGAALSRVFGVIRRRPISVLLMVALFGCLPQAAYEVIRHRFIPPTTFGTLKIWIDLLYTSGLGFGLALVRSVGDVAMIVIATRAWNIATPDQSSPAAIALKLMPLTLALTIVIQVCVTLATFAFVVPGIMLGVAWYVALSCFVLERKSVFAALARSAELTRGNRWAVFGTNFVITALSLIYVAIVKFVAKPLADRVDPDAYAAISGIATGLVHILFTLTPVAVYWELRRAREGTDAGDVAAIFD